MIETEGWPMLGKGREHTSFDYAMRIGGRGRCGGRGAPLAVLPRPSNFILVCLIKRIPLFVFEWMKISVNLRSSTLNNLVPERSISIKDMKSLA